MNLKDITPRTIVCAGIGCPAIFEAENDRYVIIGKLLPKKFSDSGLASRIGPDEVAIIIPRELLTTVAKLQATTS